MHITEVKPCRGRQRKTQRKVLLLQLSMHVETQTTTKNSDLQESAASV